MWGGRGGGGGGSDKHCSPSAGHETPCSPRLHSCWPRSVYQSGVSFLSFHLSLCRESCTVVDKNAETIGARQYLCINKIMSNHTGRWRVSSNHRCSRNSAISSVLKPSLSTMTTRSIFQTSPISFESIYEPRCIRGPWSNNRKTLYCAKQVVLCICDFMCVPLYCRYIYGMVRNLRHGQRPLLIME